MKPHAGQPIRQAGMPLEHAKAAVVLFHDRASSADDIIELWEQFDNPEVAYLAPEAAGRSWFPKNCLAAYAENEPHISSAFWLTSKILQALDDSGLPADRVVLAGFSQGACLVLEYVARYPRRFGGVAAFSGGLIGPQGRLRRHEGSLEGTPVFLGCSDIDFHVPKTRVLETAEALRGMDAVVTERIYPGMPHTLNEDELSEAREMLEALVI
jgi:predicted esterase